MNTTDFSIILEQVKSFLQEEPFYVAAMSNISSLLMDAMDELNWAGFYLLSGSRLTVGPFQGKPACIHIETGRGVCGTCVARDETIVVPDVHAFPGHIACDSASRSEIVIPIHSSGKIAGVLDIDSPKKDRFSAEDQAGLEALVKMMEEHLAWRKRDDASEVNCDTAPDDGNIPVLPSNLKLTDDDYELICDFRHDLHMNPELSGEEYRTTQKIREFLMRLPGCTVLDLPVRTGVAAQILGTVPGEIMLRADIDALPQTEAADISWKSRMPGIMHACGHDLHSASLCGAALLLSRARQSGKPMPTVDLVFQPAEEGTTGARMLIDAGLFELIHPDKCFGFHNWPSVDTGKVVCREGALMAAKRNFDIYLYGAGGHGSMPHLNIDPIVCSAAVIQSLQTVISRNVDPLKSAILSINMTEGGSPVNLVVDRVHLKATIRSLSEDVLDRAIERVETIVGKIAQAYECRSEIIWKERIPAVWNSPEMTAAAVQYAQKAGCEITDAPPSLASEDFSLYSEYVPGFYFWLGSRIPGTKTHELHTPGFLADDRALEFGAQLYAACVG